MKPEHIHIAYSFFYILQQLELLCYEDMSSEVYGFTHSIEDDLPLYKEI